MNRPIENSYISKYRYYELKYFCYQYREWEKEKIELNFFPGGNFRKTVSDPTGDLAVRLAGLEYKIEIVDRCLNEVASDIYPWLKKCIVDGKSYNVLVSDGVPCGKEYFYQRYRSFFSRINLLI